MNYLNLTISDFLGIIFIGFPVFVFCTNMLIFGIYRLFEEYWLDSDDEDKNSFLHIFHYKDKHYAPPRR